MFEHRFREFAFESTPAVVAAAPTVAFVPCPVFAAFPPAQQSFVAEVYRIARELTEAQLARPARPRVPEFSLN